MKLYKSTLFDWDGSLGFLLPKKLIERYKLKGSKEILIILEEDGSKLML